MTRIDERGRPIVLDSAARERLTAALDHEQVVAVRLFGSQATGRLGPLSDVDLGIWVNPDLVDAERHRLRLELASVAAGALRTDEVDLVILNDAPPLLQHRVLRDGSLLLDRVPALRVHLDTRAVLRYLDTEPLRDQLAEGLRMRLEEGSYGRRRSLEARLSLIDRELEVLGRARAVGLEHYLADRSLQREVERALQLSIQACIDVGAHVIAAHGLGTPGDYGDVFELLATRAELDRDLADALELAAGQRNLLVHCYIELDQRRLFEALAGEADLRAFATWAIALGDR